MDPKSSKADVCSRDTPVAEGQMEEIPTTTDGQIQPSTPLHDGHDYDHNHDDEGGGGGGDSPCHPSDPGAHKPCGAAGYAHVAEFMNMAQYGMVRKYKDLSLLNLLYLQAEIHELQADWDELVSADAEASGERMRWDYHWASMASAPARGAEGRRRWEVWERLRGRLYQYYEAVQKHHRMCDLPTPSNAQRAFISEYIANDYMNGRRAALLSPELRGEQPEVYREKWLEDLVLFEHGANRESYDGFARWVVMPVLKAAHFLCLGRGKRTIHPVHPYPDPEAGNGAPDGGGSGSGSHEKAPSAAGGGSDDASLSLVPLYQYNATCYTVLNRALNAISIILVPCAAIVSLNAVPDTNKRVGMVCAFSLVCAVGMALCSGASRIEVFAVSAAFMSVQLVFVGQQGGPAT